MELTLRAEGFARPEQLAHLTLDLRRAGVRAVNRSMQTVRTATLRGLAEDTGLAQRDIRPSLGLTRATFGQPQARLVVTGRRIPLIAFRARQTLTGVSYRLPGGRGTIAHAFLATMRSGHRGVFRRRGRARLPIVELRGPSLPQIVRNRDLFNPAPAEAVLRKNLQHEVDFLLQQRGVAAAEGADG